MSATEGVLDLAGFGRALTDPAEYAVSSWRPWQLRLVQGEGAPLGRLCGVHAIRLHDSFESQLLDLAGVRAPADDMAARQRFADETIAAAGDSEACGKWIYLPWRRTLVHLLDRDDYFDVITSRNQDKITREEQLALRAKRIGVVGLSVGGEAAVTVAQEHLCGSIVLADFDRLELSNLNRLGAGVADLGVNKAVIVARRIAEIDPYLDVRIFPEGVSADNVDAFLDGLDLLLEECDDLRLKFEIRRRARRRGLNVVYAGDERGFLSVEPYGNDPDLAPFHGRVPGPQPARAEYATPLARMRALTEWLGGWDAISPRSRDSLEAQGERLRGYPQLASEPRLAAGQIGHVARRLLLGDAVPAFVGQLDLEDWLAAGGTTGDR